MTKYLSYSWEEMDIDIFKELMEVLNVETDTRGPYFIRRNQRKLHLCNGIQEQRKIH